MIQLKQIHTYTLVAAFMLTSSLSAAQAEVVVVVSAKNSLNSLTFNQLADIFLGKTEKLPNGARVAPVEQGENSGEKEEFYRRYLNRSQAQIRAYWAKQIFTGKGEPPREFKSIEQLKRHLAANPNSIAYLEREKLDASLKVVDVEK
jgi:ABC-type phosphate transport system substrate-binding protein